MINNKEEVLSEVGKMWESVGEVVQTNMENPSWGGKKVRTELLIILSMTPIDEDGGVSREIDSRVQATFATDGMTNEGIVAKLEFAKIKVVNQAFGR